MSDNLAWLDSVDTIDQDTVEVEQQGYPWIQWVHGDPNYEQLGGVLHTGGWFLPAESAGLDPDVEIEGWTRGKMTHKNSSTQGWFKRDLTFSFICHRRAWQVQDGDQTEIFPWDRGYDQAKALGKPSGKLQVLCIVKGLDEPRPVMLTMRGSVGRAFMPGRSGETVMSRFIRCVIDPANKLNAHRGKKEKFPWRAFWLTVGPQRNSDGSPVYVTVGEGSASSKVTLPEALGLHDRMSSQELGALHVGDELIKETNTIWNDARDWAKAWSVRVESEPLDVAGNGEAEQYASEEEIPF